MCSYLSYKKVGHFLLRFRDVAPTLVFIFWLLPGILFCILRKHAANAVDSLSHWNSIRQIGWYGELEGLHSMK